MGVKKCGGRCGRVYGVSVEGVGKCVGEVRGEVWEKIRRDVRCEEARRRCGRVYGVSVGKYVGVWGR